MNFLSPSHEHVVDQARLTSLLRPLSFTNPDMTRFKILDNRGDDGHILARPMGFSHFPSKVHTCRSSAAIVDINYMLRCV